MVNGQRHQSLLDELLEGKPEEFKLKVARMIARNGIDETDPLFVLLVATGQLQALLEETPEDLDRLFKNWTREINHQFSLAEHAIVERQKAAIAEAAGDLIRTAQNQDVRRFWTPLVQGIGAMLAVLGLGLSLGYAFHAALTPPPPTVVYADKQTKLTQEQFETLNWAMSKEGQFARNLMKWNFGYLDNLSCLQDMERLNLKLYLGNRPASSGFCTIWVVAPSQRKYDQ